MSLEWNAPGAVVVSLKRTDDDAVWGVRIESSVVDVNHPHQRNKSTHLHGAGSSDEAKARDPQRRQQQH